MSTTLEEIKIRYGKEEYKEALALVEKAEREGLLHPELLVWKGRCLQLVDDTPYQLSDIENIFNQALDIDSEFTPAMLELGWFYFNVLDDATQAVELFERAITILRRQLTDAVIGKIKCLLETKKRDEVLKYLSSVTQQPLDLSKIQKIRDEIESYE